MAREAKCCERPITAADARNEVAGYAADKSAGLHGLSYKLFRSVLAVVNGSISRFVNRRVVIPLKKDWNKGNVIDNFKPINLRKTDLKILVKVIAGMSASSRN